ncbi:hypothetical protein ABEY69_15555 [Priestia filamentosa]|uniref:hypothetical protein n=1 Tax=Priestia filamentosa TaxID=1402861 RepID=UPI002E206E9C|nr:hypothetical protein [Priestia filamentosa]
MKKVKKTNDNRWRKTTLKMLLALLLMSSLSFSLVIVLDLFMNYSVARAIYNVFYGFRVMAALEFFLLCFLLLSLFIYVGKEIWQQRKSKKN